jgi:hypothetical protein
MNAQLMNWLDHSHETERLMDDLAEIFGVDRRSVVRAALDQHQAVKRLRAEVTEAKAECARRGLL